MTNVERTGTDGLSPLTFSELDQVAGAYFQELGAYWGGWLAQTAAAGVGVAAASTPQGRGLMTAASLGFRLLPGWAQTGVVAAGVTAWQGVDYVGGQVGEALGARLDRALGWTGSSQ